MLVDYERAWLALKKGILEKPSHGQRDLMTLMAEVELECQVDDNGYDPTPKAKRETEAEPAVAAPAR